MGDVPLHLDRWTVGFLEALDPCDDPTADPPPASEAMIARMIEAGPRHNVEWAFDPPLAG